MNPDNQPVEAAPDVAPVYAEEGGRLASLGPVIGIIALVIALLLGGLYLWGPMLTVKDIAPTPVVENTQTPEATPAPENPSIEALGKTSTSDEITAIEADVESTDIESIDAEMAAMEAEMDSFEGE